MAITKPKQLNANKIEKWSYHFSQKQLTKYTWFILHKDEAACMQQCTLKVHAPNRGAMRHMFARWHRNLTLTLNPNTNLTRTLKVAIIYAVKHDTKTKLHIVLYISYFPRDGVHL